MEREKRIFLFLSPDGVTCSSPEKVYPDIETFQVLGEAEGLDEAEAFENFVKTNTWILKTEFNEVICIETRIGINKGKRFFLNTEKLD